MLKVVLGTAWFALAIPSDSEWPIFWWRTPTLSDCRASFTTAEFGAMDVGKTKEGKKNDVCFLPLGLGPGEPTRE